MRVYAQVTSERASKGQGGNEYLIIDLTVGDKARESIGQVELYYSADSKNPEYIKDGITEDEWVLQYRPTEEDDWIIIAQGNVSPKGKKRKGKIGLNENTYPQILAEWENRENR